MRFGRAAAVIVALGIMLTSCGEPFVRNNPFDPAVPVTLTVKGPDSAFAQFDTVKFTVTTDPVYDYDDVQWQVGTGLQKINNNGLYQVGPISVYNARPTTVPITVRIGTRSATTNISIVFKPVGSSASFCRRLEGGDFLLGDSRPQVLDWIGKSVEVCTSTLDAHGGIIGTSNQFSSPARSLDTTVARVAPFSTTIVAVGNGTTGVVFTNGSRVDTLTVTVRQSVASLTVTPAACVPPPFTPSMVMALGDTLRLQLGAPAYDLGGTLITDAAIIQQAVTGAKWAPYPFQGDVPIGLTTDGLLTATTRGYVRLGAQYPEGRLYSPGFGGTANVNLVATCSIEVQ